MRAAMRSENGNSIRMPCAISDDVFIRDLPAKRLPRAHGTVVVGRRSASSVDE